VHDPARYLPAVYTRFEGTECMNYSPFIYAFGKENLAITGSGTIDGQAKSGPWYGMNDNSKPDRELLLKMATDGVPVEKRVFGAGHNLRPNFVQFYRSKNILVEGVTITDGPMWTVHPVLCRNVTVRGIKIVSYGPNTDGVDPESSSDVLIENVSFNTGDDSIAIKSGRNDDGRRVNVPCENIVVRHCRMGKVRRNALAIGSEVTGGVRNVYIEDCVLAEALRGVYIKSNTQRGGVVENIWFRNVQIEDIKEPAIRIGTDYGSEKGPHVPVMRDIVFEGVRARRCGMALQISGEPNSPVTNVRLKNCTFEGMAGPDRIRNCKGLVRE
jgi:polygalacturonase